jgi:DNA-binding beta-propeller fold protein YncE
MLVRPRLLVLTIALAAGCSSKRDAAPPSPVASSAPAASASAPASAAPARARRPAPVREGGALVRAASDDALYLADEDRGVLRRIPLPVDVQNPPTEVKLPGAPAQVLALDGQVLVTVRDPGLLLVFRAEGASLVEAARVPLPGDAWGLAVTPDERTALVSSAWTHRISAVDLATSTRKWSLDVPREPRGIVVRPDGKSAYVTHLVGGAVTRVDQLDGAPAARPVDLHPAPASAPIKGKKSSFDLDATLAYAAVLSPAGDRLFVPRHALGAYGGTMWFGRAAVDVLLTADDTTLAPDRAAPGPSYTKQGDLPPDVQAQESADGPVPIADPPAFVQPRAVAYRRATRTLLVAGEGSDSLAELDARSIDPALGALHRYDFADRKKMEEGEPSRCGAPTGLALSADDAYAWVFCRSSADLAIVKLDPLDGKGLDSSIIPVVHLADDPLPEKAARGRRLFYTAVDAVVSGGIGCAGCHPDGRDDGHVWQEQIVEGTTAPKAGLLTAAPTRNGSIWSGEHGAVLHKGYPRQTPMLAGRVAARGPYGWYGRESILEQRLTVGFGQHGGGFWGVRATDQVGRAEAIAAFLRRGLVTPPKERRALTAIEQRGEEIFGSAETRCATCHFPGTDYTDRSVVSLGIPPWRPLFTTEARDQTYKTPSLLFVGGTPPYFHDGRAATLADLIDQNDDHMGRTRQLSRDDRAALAAFLATIGLVDASGEPDPVKAPTATDLTAGLAASAPVTRDRSEIPPPPAERSLAPTWPEWNNAPAVPLTRTRKGCALYQVREWFRVHCAVGQLGQMILSTGPREGVAFADGRFGEGGDLIFPARRGDRRVFEIDELAQRHKYSVSWGPAAVVTETWLPEDDAPTITLD